MKFNKNTSDELVKVVKTTLDSLREETFVTSIVVGFSGGADSTALLLILHELEYNICAVHLQHGLREDEAEDDAAWCKQFCRHRNIDFDCEYLAVKENSKDSENLEAAARRLRIKFWRDYLDRHYFQKQETAVVALAHHADDAVEDFFLRLMRGSNSSGLSGLREVREINGVTFIRPMLSCRRKDIEKFLIDRGIRDWREDSSNDDSSFRRNAVRHRLLPLINEIGGEAGLAGCRQSSRVVREDAEYLEKIAEEYSRKLVSTTDFQNIPAALQSRVLRKWIYQHTGHDHIPSAASIQRLRQEAKRKVPKSRSIPLGGGIILTIEAGKLKLTEIDDLEWRPTVWDWHNYPVLELESSVWKLIAKSTEITPAEIPERSSDYCQFFSMQELPRILEVRKWREGDRMIPFGHKTETKVKDLFQKLKVPRSERADLPLLVADDQIIWIAGVCRSALFPVTEKTGSVLRIECIKSNISNSTQELKS
ncbi:MAG: tRNA lysidine(34) synthetase TilS [Verrucomicrobiota bacterium]